MFVLVSALLPGLTAASPAALALTGSYEQTVSVDGRPMVTFHITVKEDKVRAKTSYQGQEEVTIRNAEGTFRFLPAQRVIFKLPEDVSRQSLLDDIDNYKTYLDQQKAVVAGSEVFQERECDVYEFKDPISGGMTRAWVWKEKGFPLKIEVGAPEGKVVVEMSNVQLDQPVDDALFELPANIRKVRMEDMLAAAQNQAAGAAPEEAGAPAEAAPAEEAAPAPAQ
jgi:outer membrane lipoprotein-sorting protein